MDVSLLLTRSLVACLTLFAGHSLIATSQADIVELYVTGAGGDGLLGTNVDPPATNPGSGGMGPMGITLDTDTNILMVQLLWGLDNGYDTMSGEVTKLHLHGPTADRAPNNFGQVNMNIILNLGNSLNFDPSASAGGLDDSFFISNEEKNWILSGRTYINVHTELNPMGEIRGYVLQSVPEPAAALALLVLGVCGLARRRTSSTRQIG